MLLSSSFLKSSYDRFKKNRGKNKKLKEGYNMANSSMAGVSASFDAFLLCVAALFFILELFLLFYALSIAIRCTKAGPSRVAHICLAIFFTTPYLLVAVFFNKCTQDLLENSTIFMSPLDGDKSYGSPGMRSGVSFL